MRRRARRVRDKTRAGGRDAQNAVRINPETEDVTARVRHVTYQHAALFDL